MSSYDELINSMLNSVVTTPNPHVEKRLKTKIENITIWLFDELMVSLPSPVIRAIAQLSETGYSIRSLISAPVITQVKTEEAGVFNFSVSGYNSKNPYPFNLTSIQHVEYPDTIFLFDLDTFAGCLHKNQPYDYLWE